MKISILLPYKENFTKNDAGAVSLFVNQTLKVSKYRKYIKVFGNTSFKDTLNLNYKNINFDKRIFRSSSKVYVDNFLKDKFVINSKIIEVHNRPNYVKFIKKKFSDKVFLYFHNDPLSMDGSTSVKDRLYLLNNIDKLIFNSEWSKNRFFIDLKHDGSNQEKIHICYQSSSNVKIDFKKKKKIITFIGKLNRAKGYDLFGNSVISILNKYKDWEATVIGNEEREKINFYHERLNIIGFKSNSFILNYLKKASISVVCSRWEEPFGRASLEAASRGAAVIISKNGGLPETAKSALILKSLDKKELIETITGLIDDKKKLLEYQKKNYDEFHLSHEFVSDSIDKIRNDTFPKIFNLNKLSILRIFHITNFNNRFDGRLHYNTSKRLNNGFIRLGHNVLSISDRDIINTNKSLNDMNGVKALQRSVINNFKNFKPDLVVLGHADSLSLETIDYIKNQNVKIVQWFLDPVGKNSPDYYKNKKRILDKSENIDASFLTSDPGNLDFKIKNSFYMPNPSDSSFETLKNYENDCQKDLFFAMSHGVHRGILKKGKFDDREIFINKLISLNKDIRFDIYGMNQKEPIWGNEFIKLISNSSMGLNLSRGNPVRYYSSDRIAQLMGNGLMTFIDEKTSYGDFFTNKEIVLYKDLDDLNYKLNKYKRDHRERKLIAKNGKIKYMKHFNSSVVCKYIIDKTFKLNYKKEKFLWEK
jgi:glycosyltransferase involved in cell wall biosynthesis